MNSVVAGRRRSHWSESFLVRRSQYCVRCVSPPYSIPMISVWYKLMDYGCCLPRRFSIVRLAALAFVGNHRLLALCNHRRGWFLKLILAALWERTGGLQVRRAASVGGLGRLANCNPAVTDKADAAEYIFRHRGPRRARGSDGVSVGGWTESGA